MARPTTIAVLHSKGGTGKTTISIHLARALERMGRRVLLVDTDLDQRSSLTWRSLQEAGGTLTVVAMQSLRRELSALAGSFDAVVIDGAAKLERLDAEAIAAADVVLMPVQPSALDVWPLQRIAGLVLERQAITDGRPAGALVMSRVQAIREAGELPAIAQDLGVTLLPAQLSERVAYRRAIGEGRTVFEAPEGETPSEAQRRLALAAEVEALASAALALAAHPTTQPA